MAQLSRPYQIGLIVVALFAAVFVFALHGRSSSPASPSAPAPAAPASTPASTPAAQATANGGSTGSAAEQAALSHHVYQGSAPGVGGLSRAIAKAHGAAATSQKNNAQLEQKSAQASSVTASSTTTSTPAGSVAKHSVVVTRAPATPGAAASTTAASTTAASATGAAATKAPAAGPARQRAVEAELKQGKIVVLLFWNPRGTDDRVVHHQLKLMFAFHNNPATAKAEVVRHAGKFFGRNFNHTVVVHETLGASVAAYGSITRGVQVYGTPTLLILNSTGKTITLTGVTDAYGIEQAIFEAHGG